MIKLLAILIFIAILPLPYGYYEFLRFAVCLGAVYYLINNFNTLSDTDKGVLIVAALVYNPFAPLHMAKMLWVVINLISGMFFLKIGKE